ncbi:MAG: hypothetical protein ACR2OU_01325, partial [Thermomicrobiales bacterium]
LGPLSTVGNAIAGDENPIPTLEATDAPTTEPVVEPTLGVDVPTAEPTLETGLPTAEPALESVATPPEESSGFSITAVQATTGTITTTASNSSPLPGEIVSFTIEISGTANAGTEFMINDIYTYSILDVVGDPAAAFVTSSSTNLDIGTATYGIDGPGNDRQRFSFFSTVITAGAYSATFNVQLQVHEDAIVGSGIESQVVMYESSSSDGLLLNDGDTLKVTAPAQAPTGTITKTASNPNPVPGEIMTFTIEISGTADAGTVLALEDFYQPTNLEVAGDPTVAFVTVSSSNLTLGTPAYTGGAQGFSLQSQVDATGPFSATFTVQMQVTTDAPVGATIDASANLYVPNSDPLLNLGFDSASLNVTAPPTTATITKTASNPNPARREIVTYTVTVSGMAATGAAFTLTDVVPENMTLVEVRQGAVTNVTGVTIGEGPVIDFTASATGAYSAIFTLDMRVDRAARRGSTIDNTACVDIAGGTQDTCATATVTVTAAHPGTALDMLIKQIIALLIVILGSIIPGG